MLSKRYLSSLILFLLFLLLSALFWLNSGPDFLLPQTLAATMSITHIVLFQFKADASPAAVKDACARMLALKDNCVHPTSQKPYIKSAVGGADNSPEGMQGGITHAFVMEFASAGDREYYVSSDPTHQEFVKSLGGIMEKAQVVDFANGVY